MTDLIARLEAAEAGSRDLDFALGQAVGLIDENHIYTAPSGDRLTRGNCVPWPTWTTSIDAAVALANRVCPDHDWSVGCLPVSDDADYEEHHNFGALLYSRYTKPYDAMAHGGTPALALCAAILRAQSEARV